MLAHYSSLIPALFKALVFLVDKLTGSLYNISNERALK